LIYACAQTYINKISWNHCSLIENLIDMYSPTKKLGVSKY
jgi:hypothetical protein